MYTRSMSLQACASQWNNMRAHTVTCVCGHEPLFPRQEVYLLNARQKVQLLYSEWCFNNQSYPANCSFFWGTGDPSTPPAYNHASWAISLHCSPRSMSCSKKQEADPLDGPLSSLACWLLVGFGQWDTLVGDQRVEGERSHGISAQFPSLWFWG